MNKKLYAKVPLYLNSSNHAGEGKWITHFCAGKSGFQRTHRQDTRPKYHRDKYHTSKVTEPMLMFQPNAGATLECVLHCQSMGWLPASHHWALKQNSSILRCILRRSHSWEWQGTGQEWLTRICSSLGQGQLSPYKSN